MTRLQLATLLSWTDEKGLQGRKRLQKVIFFLQNVGCPLDSDYTLHHFGPYSRDVADTCDEMVAAGLIEERAELQGGQNQYSYKLLPHTNQLIKLKSDISMAKFKKIGVDLINENIWSLELGSTILYFYQQTNDWVLALTKACEFKKVSTDNVASAKAFELAKKTLDQAV